MSKIFGERLRQIRRENCLTQSQIGEFLSVSKMTVSAWETNKQEPCIEDLRKLARFLDVTSDYLIGLECYDGTREI